MQRWENFQFLFGSIIFRRRLRRRRCTNDFFRLTLMRKVSQARTNYDVRTSQPCTRELAH